MTIHSDHPFLPPEDDRDPLRRMRGRTPSPVTVWTSGSDAGRNGLTVSSILIAEGDPAHILGLVDPDSDFWSSEPQTFVVNVLGQDHRYLADAFAGTVPAPGGPFTVGEWDQSAWGPVLAGGAGWMGVRLADPAPRSVGWGLLVDAVVEHVALGDVDALIHLRGRYR